MCAKTFEKTIESGTDNKKLEEQGHYTNHMVVATNGVVLQETIRFVTNPSPECRVGALQVGPMVIA